MKVLVIVEMIPEETIISIVDMTDEEYAFFSKVHGYYSGLTSGETEKDEIYSIINSALADVAYHREYCETETQLQYFSKWKRIDAPEEYADISNVDKLIVCGFYL